MHGFHATLSHLHLKFERNVIFILLFIFFIAGFLTSEYLVKSDMTALLKEKSQCQSLLAQSGSNPSCLSEKDLALYVEKEKTLQKIVVSPVYFSSQVRILSPAKKEITISLQGNPSMKVDSADLSIIYPNTIQISSLLPGKAFPSYPRMITEKNKILISGASTINETNFVYGQPNTVFVTIIVEKIGPPAQEEVLTLDSKNTKIYFQGVSILDETKNITKIEL